MDVVRAKLDTGHQQHASRRIFIVGSVIYHIHVARTSLRVRSDTEGRPSQRIASFVVLQYLYRAQFVYEGYRYRGTGVDDDTGLRRSSLVTRWYYGLSDGIGTERYILEQDDTVCGITITGAVIGYGGGVAAASGLRDHEGGAS